MSDERERVYEVRDTSAVVTLGPVTIEPIFVLVGEAGVLAYGLQENMEMIAGRLNEHG